MNPPPISRRFGLRLVLCWLGTVAVFEQLARAHDPSIGFHIRASYPVPDFSQPGTFIRGPVIYNLPDPATSTSIYAGPADSYLDVFVDVNHGTEMAAGFGVIMFLDGNGKVTFEPDPINLDHPDPPNNIPYALRHGFSPKHKLRDPVRRPGRIRFSARAHERKRRRSLSRPKRKHARQRQRGHLRYADSRTKRAPPALWKPISS